MVVLLSHHDLAVLLTKTTRKKRQCLGKRPRLVVPPHAEEIEILMTKMKRKFHVVEAMHEGRAIKGTLLS